MMKQRSILKVLVVLIPFLAVQWLSVRAVSGSAATEKNTRAAEIASGFVQNEPKTDHKKNIFINLLDMQFVLIPHGKFIMGSPSSEPGRTIFEMQNEVSIDKPFYILATEVTQYQWERVMGDNPSFFSECGKDCPVENVSWVDVQDFIKKLNQMDSSSKYRLPTEAEWEYVCRSGSSTAFCSGDYISFECHSDSVLDKLGWYYCNSEGKTHPVAQKAPNRWGVYDMHGNVYEWCQDVYVTSYAKVINDKSEDIDPMADKAGRSCSFDDTAVSCRSAARVNFNPNIRANTIGFRLVREPVYYKIEMTSIGENPDILKKTKTAFDTTPSEKAAQAAGTLKKRKRFALQVAATRDAKSAERLLNRLKNDGHAVYKLKVEIPDKGTWYRIRIGDFEHIEKAQQMQLKLAKDNIESVVVKN